MELLSIKLARTIWFVNALDINPRGINLWHTFIPAVAEKYKFTEYPTKMNLDPNREAGDRFIGGSYRTPHGSEVLINFTSFDDGMVADTRSSTRDSEGFLEELSQWIVNEFGLVFYSQMIKKRGYVSELHVKSEHLLRTLHPKFIGFANRISALVSTPDEVIPYEPSGVMFSAPASSYLTPSGFHFERLLDTPFLENRYYSKAPVHTDTHLELLSELEQILAP